MLDQIREALPRHVPPTSELMDSGLKVLGPAAGTALIVFALGLVLFGKRRAVPAAAIATLASFAVANYGHLVSPRSFKILYPYWPDVSGGRWHWVPLLFLLAQVDGVFLRSPGTPCWGAWRLRIGLGALSALVLLPNELRDKWWAIPAFTATVAIGWHGACSASRNSPGGAVPLGLSSAIFGASMVIAHAHSGLHAEELSIPAATLFGLALVAFIARVDVSGAAAGPALLLPTILFVAQRSSFSEVPWHAFLYAALPFVAIGLVAIPPICRWSGIVRWPLFWLLCMGPTVAAIILAVQTETLIEDW